MAEKIEQPTAESSIHSGSSRLTNQGVLNTEDDKTHEAAITIQNVGGNVDVSSADDERNKNPFSDPKVAAYYETVYEKSQYECRHVFDPTLEWTDAEERKIVRKLDWHVCLWAVSDSKPCLGTWTSLTSCSVLCSLLCRSIEGISVKQYLITC
jgi:hypothetical protein